MRCGLRQKNKRKAAQQTGARPDLEPRDSHVLGPLAPLSPGFHVDVILCPPDVQIKGPGRTPGPFYFHGFRHGIFDTILNLPANSFTFPAVVQMANTIFLPSSVFAGNRSICSFPMFDVLPRLKCVGFSGSPNLDSDMPSSGPAMTRAT